MGAYLSLVRWVKGQEMLFGRGPHVGGHEDLRLGELVAFVADLATDAEAMLEFTQVCVDGHGMAKEPAHTKDLELHAHIQGLGCETTQGARCMVMQ